MHARTLLTLLLLTGLTACARPPQTSATPAPPRTPGTAVPASPSPPAPLPLAAGADQADPPDNPQLAVACDRNAPANQRLDALKGAMLDYVQGRIATLQYGKKGALPCIRHYQTDDKAVVIATAPYGNAEVPLVIAWKQQNQWQAAGAVGQWLNDATYPIQGGLTNGRPDLILVTSSFSGGAKVLFHVGVNDAGAPEFTYGPGFGKSGFETVKPNLILADAQQTDLNNELFPLACEACKPMRGQELIRWDGKQFVIGASRNVPNPVTSLNLLRAYLQRANLSAAARFVASPALLEQIGPWLLPPSDNYEEYADDLPIGRLETHNWDALPPDVRTSLPDSLRTFIITRQAEGASVDIHLARQAEEWVVTGLDARGSVPTTATLEETAAALRALAAAGSGDQRRHAADQVAVDLTLFLPTAVGEAVTGNGSGDGQPLRDDRLPGVKFFLKPSDKVRLVSFSDEPKHGFTWTWLQWWDGGRSRLQALESRNFDGVETASLQPDGSLLVRWESSVGEESKQYRLDRQEQRWVEQPKQ